MCGGGVFCVACWLLNVPVLHSIGKIYRSLVVRAHTHRNIMSEWCNNDSALSTINVEWIYINFYQTFSQVARFFFLLFSSLYMNGENSAPISMHLYSIYIRCVIAWYPRTSSIFLLFHSFIPSNAWVVGRFSNILLLFFCVYNVAFITFITFIEFILL